MRPLLRGSSLSSSLGRRRRSPLRTWTRTSASSSLASATLVPGFVLVFATDPGTKCLLVLVSLWWLHTFLLRIVSRQPHVVHLFVVCFLHSIGFFLCKAGMTKSLHTVVEFSVNTRAGNANKGSNRQVDALGKLRVAIGTSLVGRKTL